MNLKKQWKRGKDKVKNAVRHPKKAAKEAIKAGKKAVKKAEKLAKKVDKAAEKITRPVTKPIAKVLAPVIKPVAKPLAKVLKPVNKILKPLNAVLTPVKILTGNGTILDVVTAVAKELVISAPISNALNRVLNPIDAIIQDATKPIALLTTTVANTQNLVSNVAQIKKNLTPPAPVKQKATQTTKGEIPAKKPTPVKPAPSQTGQVAGNLSKEQKQNEIYRKNVQKPTASTQPSPVPPKAAPVTQKSTQANNVETPATKPAPAKSTPSQARQPASNLTKEQKAYFSSKR